MICVIYLFYDIWQVISQQYETAKMSSSSVFSDVHYVYIYICLGLPDAQEKLCVCVCVCYDC